MFRTPPPPPPDGYYRWQFMREAVMTSLKAGVPASEIDVEGLSRLYDHLEWVSTRDGAANHERAEQAIHDLNERLTAARDKHA